MKPIILLLVLAFYSQSSFSIEPRQIILKNDHIQLIFDKDKHHCTLKEISRIDGKDKITMQSMEFEILFLNNERLTVKDFKLTGISKPNNQHNQTLRINYILSKKSGFPKKISILYELGKESYYRKQIIIESDSSGFIDRLQTMRFTTPQKVIGGGFGQPLFIGNWFLGMDYPGFYSWHSNNFKPPEFNLRNPYDIDLEGRDEELNPKKGMVTLYHFPGYAEQNHSKNYEIKSKKVVMGISRDATYDPETALLNYIEETRLPTRSFLHFNNWYSIDAKKITVEDFVQKTYIPIKKQFSKYGVKLDAMVPDNGWQDSKFEYEPFRIYSPKHDEKHEDLVKIKEALENAGTELGIWLAIDGRNTNVDIGIEKAGYRSAFSDTFNRNKYSWTSGKPFFDILDPTYQDDLRKSIRYLIEDAHVIYFKHDFNHLFTSHYITDRHAREKCLDATLNIMQYERELNPEVFLNYTNGSWFSPFWLQYVHTLWMMSGDSGGNGDYPQLSLREGATTYRDKYFYDNFRIERKDRPVIPISNFMTHGILYSKRKPFTNFNDIIDDWSNYVVMYYARGTTVKELYITPDLLTEKEWEVLGRATKWAVANQDNLLNTVYIGGDPSKGNAYGYISWNNEKAILTVRNPQRLQQNLHVPFDERVYFTGANDVSYKVKCIYPYIEEMPWKPEPGKGFDISVPGDIVQVFEIEKGSPESKELIKPNPLTEPDVKFTKNGFQLNIKIPDADYRRYELLIECYPAKTFQIFVNDQTIEQCRINTGKKWSLSSHNLAKYKGSEIQIKGVSDSDENLSKWENTEIKAYILADQKVHEQTKSREDTHIPLSIMQGYRRSTKLIFVNHPKIE